MNNNVGSSLEQGNQEGTLALTICLLLGFDLILSHGQWFKFSEKILHMGFKLIDSYNFGEIVIEGKTYKSDVIVFLDKVVDDWWRKEGHKVHNEDLEEVLNREPKPELLILGTGYYGQVKVPSKVRSILESQGIKMVDQPTTKAYQKFNSLLKSNKRVVGAFHLTC